MTLSKTVIVVIDDNLSQNDPIIVELSLNFSNIDIILFNDPHAGLEYINDNLSKKMIVLQDYDLGAGNINGAKVFNTIREQTSLIYFIIMTAKKFSTLPYDDLVDFINNDALAITNNTDTDIIIKMVQNAVHKLETRVDCILEEWIVRHDDNEKNVPYMMTANGTVYSLAQLLKEIRKQTEIGQNIERNILMLAIDLLTRGKNNLND